MSSIKAIFYVESREAYFTERLKKERRKLDNLVKYGTDHDACAEQGEIVGFYEDAITALRSELDRVGCEYCNSRFGIASHHINEAGLQAGTKTNANFCPMCGKKLREDKTDD